MCVCVGGCKWSAVSPNPSHWALRLLNWQSAAFKNTPEAPTPLRWQKMKKKKHFHSFFWVYISFSWLLFNSVKKCTSWSILAAFFVLFLYRFVIDFSYKGRKVRLTLSFQDNRLVLILRLHPESIRIFSSQAKNIQYRTSSIILHNVLCNLHMVVKETSSSLCTEWLH